MGWFTMSGQTEEDNYDLEDDYPVENEEDYYQGELDYNEEEDD